MILLSITLIAAIFFPNTMAVAVEIVFITPRDQHGIVGDTIIIDGTVNTTNGLYQIWFGQYKVVEANATANGLTANFSVPELPQGNYTVTLHDVSLNSNSSTWFYIDTAYHIEAKTPTSPEQLQEGDTVEIWANMTGAKPSTLYYANITVKTPANTTHWVYVMLNTTNAGTGHNTTIAYPTHFSGVANTNFTGTYNIAFNKTLATDTFVIGLTNSTEYHRFQIVDIKATGYKSNENASVKIKFGGKAIYSNNATASIEGLISANWTVPSNATIGTYTVNITSISPSPTTKSPKDVQNFNVPGYDVNMTTRNLAKETVANVTVRVFENENSLINLTSNLSGLAQTKLEIGNYTAKAFYKGEEVGEFWTNIINRTALDFYVNLTNLKITALAKKDGAEILVPDVQVHLTLVNETLSTNITGIAIMNFLLPNRTYVLNASRYGVSFNITSIVIGTAVPWYNVTLVTPTLTLRVNTTRPNSEPISNVTVKAQELTGGLFYEGKTNAEGTIVFNCAFGKYAVEVYDADGIKLNETSVDLFQNKNALIVCKLYGLTVSFRVVDYLGQPISNVNVTLQRENVALRSNRTQANGVATFNNVTGGSLQVSTYVFNQMQPDAVKIFYVENSTTIEIKLEEYVALVGFLFQTAVLTTIILITVAILLLFLSEVYRRKHLKPQKGSKPEPK